ncbi:lipopolysaccharide biosynthesis glycosyltransferase [Hymenobacter luteus]|uniref:Lipopolysaccharide biosynthesis glycosyltransferase n=2 Tax=Hymenobacter TaxID=89966 RepID=A0A7W9T1C5_9BACT|nr:MULTISPECIES: glycosyltransferase family 8 protein [Hymenobacter]MBB4600605.1 lipopolysaccharide biosynthesis glycosyltransferase [Hymenobacter latericoloratus]MBB6059188.1 lipopolysaccharide biosynthesis glycosyltransferase [Hymenobacter luteus]
MSTNPATIHIAIAFDEVYVTPVYVLLTSIFSNNRNSQVQVHAIATDVPEAEKARMVEFVRQQGGDMHFYVVSPEVTSGFPVPGPDEPEAYITMAAYYRLFFPRLVPQDIERLLYLDIDMLVIGSLDSMYQTDLQGAAVGAVMEIEVPLRSEIGIRRLEDYFNSGMLLMHLPRWREQQISEQAIEVIVRTPKEVLLYHDQDALNVVFDGRWHRLESRYNLMKAYIPHDLARRDLRTYLADKVIIHYNGRNKPWHRACINRLRFLYPHYLRQSPVARSSRYMPKPITKETLKQLVHSRVMETYFNYPKIGQLWRRLKRGRIDS